MPRHLTCFVAPLVWLITAVPLGAQTTLLKAIPDNALGLATVNSLGDASAKIQKLTEKMNLPVPELLPLVKMFSGAPEGIDDKGSLAGVALPGDADSTWGMSFAVYVPVTDYSTFIKQLDPKDADATITEVTVMGQKFLAAKKDGFAVLVGEEQKDVLDAVLASSKNLTATMAPVADWLAEQQAAVVVTPAGKKLIFKKVAAALAEAKEAAGDKPEDDEPAVQAQARVGKQMLQSIQEMLLASEPQLNHLALGIRIDDKTALHLATRVMFAPDSALARWATNARPPKGGPLVGLPPDQFVVAYGGTSLQADPLFGKLIDLVATTGLQMLGLDEDARKQYTAILARYRANQLSSCGLLGPLRPGDSITSTSAAVEHVKDAKEQLKLTRDQFQILAKAEKSDDAKVPRYTLSDITIGDLKAIELVMDMSAMATGLENAGPAEGFVRGFMSGLFGAEGKMRIYFAVADDTHLVSAYSKPLLERMIAHVRSGAAGLEADKQIAITTGLLPSESQWVAYVSPQGLIQWVDTLLRQSLPAEMKFKLPAFPPSDPIGLAAKASAGRLDAEMVLPESVIAGIGQYVGLVQQMIQGGGNPLP